MATDLGLQLAAAPPSGAFRPRLQLTGGGGGTSGSRGVNTPRLPLPEPPGPDCQPTHVACPSPDSAIRRSMASSQLGEAFAMHHRGPACNHPRHPPMQQAAGRAGQAPGQACRLGAFRAGPWACSHMSPLPRPRRTRCQRPRIMRNAFSFSLVQCV